MFLDEVIAAKKAGLTEVSAKVQELRMAECKPLKRTYAVRLEPSNLKYEVEEIYTGGIFESQIVKRQNDDVTYNDAHVPTEREKKRESANSFFDTQHGHTLSDWSVAAHSKFSHAYFWTVKM